MRSPLTRYAIAGAGAAGTLAAAALAPPATATESSRDGPDRRAPRPRKGVVTAGQPAAAQRAEPCGKVVRVAFRGDIATVHRRTTGQKIGGGTRWYLRTDGAWAYGSARYIRALDPTPRR